jgi:hypothetical protein
VHFPLRCRSLSVVAVTQCVCACHAPCPRIWPIPPVGTSRAAPLPPASSSSSGKIFNVFLLIYRAVLLIPSPIPDVGSPVCSSSSHCIASVPLPLLPRASFRLYKAHPVNHLSFLHYTPHPPHLPPCRVYRCPARLPMISCRLDHTPETPLRARRAFRRRLHRHTL